MPKQEEPERSVQGGYAMEPRRFGLAILLVVSSLVPAAGALAQKQGGMLHVTHRDNPPSASIHEEATISTVMPFASVFNNLVVFDQAARQNTPDNIVPELATEWKWNANYTKLTFKLRDDVKFHDGKPFTSADVKCTWDQIIGKSEAARFRKNPRASWYFNLREVTT